MSKLMVVDTETGGLDASRQSILSFGAVLLDGSVVRDSMQIFIKEPRIYAEPEALAINKIDLKWLRKNGLPPVTAVAEIVQFIGKHFQLNQAVLAGQNIAFDVGFMQRLWRLAYGKEWRKAWEMVFNHRTHDTMHVLRFLGVAGALPFQTGSLQDAARFFNIDPNEFKPHNALDDARLTAMVLVELTEYVGRLARAYRENYG